MKCPGCKFVCSDLRDLCPKCFMDLREHKKLLGLPVAYPKLSYDELLAKTVKPAITKSKGPAGPDRLKTSLFGGLRSLISRPKIIESTPQPPTTVQPATKPPPPAPPTHEKPVVISPPDIPVIPDIPIIAEAAPVVAAVPETTAEAEALHISSTEDIGAATDAVLTQEHVAVPSLAMSPAPAPAVLDFSDEEGDLNAILDKIIGDTTFEVDAVKETKQTDVAKDDSVHEFEVTVDLDQVGEQETIESSIEKSEISFVEELDAVEVQGEAVPVIDQPETLASAEQPFTVEPSVNDINYLFASAEHELAASGLSSELEFSSHQFVANPKRNDIEILFDLAFDAFEKPETESLIDSQIVTSDVRKVESKTLARQLEFTQQAFGAKPFALSKGTARSATPAEKNLEPAHSPAELLPAPLLRQAMATLIDCVFLVVSAFILSSAAVLLSAYTSDSALDFFDKVNLIRLITFILYTILIGAYLYPMVALVLYQRTIGMDSTRLRLVNEHLESPGTSNVLIRSLIVPVSLIFGGWLPALFGRRSLHDFLARTRLVSEE